MVTMLDEVSLDVVARAQRLRRGFGWGDVFVVAAIIIWGVNVVVVKLALTDSGPFTYSAIRYVLGGLALCGLARWLEGPLVRPRGTDAWLIAAAAAAGVLVNQASFAGALALTNADNIAMISGTSPLMVVGWLVWRNREHFEAKVWGGLGLGNDLGLYCLNLAHEHGHGISTALLPGVFQHGDDLIKVLDRHI